MTTTCAVAARHVVRGLTSRTIRSRVSVLAAGGLLLTSVLGGCGSGNLLGSSDLPTQSAAGPAVLPTQAAQVSQRRIGLAPVMGAPDAVSKQVGTQLGSALERQRVVVAQGADKPDYTLRGYMVATKEKTGTKVSYIFDLTDPAGKRVNRIQGEELAQGGAPSDPWAAVTPEVAQKISDKAATSLVATLSSLASGPAGGGAASPPVGVGASPSSTSAQPAVASGSTTGSIGGASAVATASVPAGGPAVAVVPAVVGAPGDGNDSLSNAMRNELQQAGLGAAASGQKGYSVAGKVTVGAVKDGKQPIKIDWRVSDPAGGLLAVVSQNNEIQAGSLDGQWGNIAGEAAQGAASRIKQLIDESEANGGASRTKSAATRSKT